MIDSPRTLAVLLVLLTLAAPATGNDKPSPPKQSAARVDHLLVGAADLDRAVAEFERATGVRPIYGGKHPTGTHNALVSLGEGLYLELIAVQPGVTPPPFFQGLTRLQKLAPIGWAVAVTDIAATRRRLEGVGFKVSEATPGSRVTPSGATLRWQTIGLDEPLVGAPFYIAWDPDTTHPAATSPRGCKLERFTVGAPDKERLDRLVSTLDLAVPVVKAEAEGFEIALSCPKGKVTFES